VPAPARPSVVLPARAVAPLLAFHAQGCPRVVCPWCCHCLPRPVYEPDRNPQELDLPLPERPWALAVTWSPIKPRATTLLKKYFHMVRSFKDDALRAGPNRPLFHARLHARRYCPKKPAPAAKADNLPTKKVPRLLPGWYAVGTLPAAHRGGLT
jgi:hypothetical protein